MSPLKPADTQDPKIDSLLGELGELTRQAQKKVSILKGNEQLFASSYKTVLPSVEELRAELQKEQALIEERLLTESTE
ncbi:hypothetical protein JFT86_04850 [Pseudomonas sp. TH06]|nr:hypothetical protein [Pseudomonas sp. TH06]MBK5526267.1 hypothetical protein [Pseudomonas sp. TH06]